MTAAGVAATITHLVAVEAFEIIGWRVIGPVRRIGAMVAMMRVEMVVHMAIEVMAAVEPRAGADEDAAVEPLRAIVPVGCAVIGSVVIVAIGTGWLGSNVYAKGHLSRAGTGNSEEQGGRGNSW
jgi:hypothetical protein